MVVDDSRIHESASRGDSIESLESLLDMNVRTLVQWYQIHKKWPRRLHRITTASVIVAGAMIPLFAAVGESWARAVTAGLGAVVAALASLNASYKWERTWRIFTDAQTHLEDLLAEWDEELVRVRGEQLSKVDQLSELRATALRLLRMARAIRASESRSYFSSRKSESLEGDIPRR